MGIIARRRVRHLSLAVVVTLGAFLLAGCGVQVPTDPGGSLARINGGELRVGISAEQTLSTADNIPTGPLPDLAEQFARSIDATVSWQIAGEETLVNLLKQGEIDLAVGRFTPDTAWGGGIAISRPFAVKADGKTLELVAFLQGGENALLSEFEAFNDKEGRSA